MSIWTMVVIHEADFPRDPNVAVTLYGSRAGAIDALRDEYRDDIERWSEIEREKVGLTDADLLDTMRRYGVLVFIKEHRMLPPAVAEAA